MASSNPLPVASTKETTNYARLCRLLVDVGSHALRDTFNSIHAPAGLHGVLLACKPQLQRLRNNRILNPTQWGELYPTISSHVSSASFDITLLMVLLRNICGLRAPATGWDPLPPPADTSTEANIARVKYYRNTMYAHASQASVDDTMFNTYWKDISNALVALGGASYGAAINKLKNECMDPETEEHYRELLKQWKKDEDNIKDKLEGIDDKIEGMRSEFGNKLDTLLAQNKDEASRLYDQLIKKEIRPDSYLADKTYTPELKRVLSVTCGRLAASLEQEIAEALIISITAKANLERPSMPMQYKYPRGIYRSSSVSVNMWVTVILECIKESKDNSDLYKHLASKFGELLELKTVTLKNTQISNDEVFVLAHALKTNKTLTELDLSCNSIGVAGAASLADALKCNTTLKVLNLSQNNVGVEGAECLADGLRQDKPTLENLNMSSNSIGVAGAKKLADVLESTALKVLDLSHNNIGNDGAASLSNALKCQAILAELDLSRNEIDKVGAASLADALKCNSTLKELNLSHNDIGDNGALCLADTLKQFNQTLENLNLSSTKIGVAGTFGLADMLKFNRTLFLDLFGNHIGAEGYKRLSNNNSKAGRVRLPEPDRT